MRKLLGFVLIVLIAFSILSTLPTKAQSNIPAWQPNTFYAVNALVTYNGTTYQCRQAHTSQVGWEPPNVPALWLPVSSGNPTNTNTPTKTTTPRPGATATNTYTPTPTATTGGGVGCTVVAWNSTTVYVGGNQASYNGHLWQAKWWTQGDVPGGPAGVWTDLGLCNGGGSTNTPTPTPTNTRQVTFQPPTNTSTPSRNPTMGPTVPPGPLPKHVITGYWQDFTGNGAQALRLRDVPSSYVLIAVAFANATGMPGAVSFSIDSQLSSALGGYTDANFISDINTLHSQGRKVIISVGGQNGAISVSDASSASNFANSVFSIMTQYGFDGVDIDLENGINPTFMASALQQLSSKAGSGLIITLAPQTIDMQSTSSSYFQLALNIKSILTIVNMQYYNSGTMLGCDGQVYGQGTENFLTALACIQLQGGLRPDQVGLGLPANSSGAGGGAVTPSVVNAALDCLETGSNCGSFHPPSTWPGLRGAMDWDINWDANAGYQFANTVSGHFGSLP